MAEDSFQLRVGRETDRHALALSLPRHATLASLSKWCGMTSFWHFLGRPSVSQDWKCRSKRSLSQRAAGSARCLHRVQRDYNGWLLRNCERMEAEGL